jgi:C4-dicarboxylate-binding protein DctP
MVALRFAGYQPARSVHTRALHALRDSLAARAGAAVSITLTDNIVETGRKAANLLHLVASGEIDVCYFASSYLAARVPALGMFDAPFRAGAREAVFAELDGPTGTRLAEQVAAATDYRVLAWWDNGIRHISNALRPIRTPADCVGMRLRTLDNAQHQAAFRRLGFQPMFVDVADLPRAVADGAVDAQENPLTNLLNFNLQTHHRHVSLTGHLLGIVMLLVNRNRYDSLPDHLRHMVDAGVRESEAVQRALAAAEDANCLRLLAEADVAVIPSEEIDLQAFRSAVAAD